MDARLPGTLGASAIPWARVSTVPPDCHATLQDLSTRGGRVLVLTGAGISEESGIPTFRGPEGYWTVGQENYRPEDLATLANFNRLPEDIWGWYLYRRGVCVRAEPNPAHRAFADLEAAVGDRMTLVTQNVDGLHLRAGNTIPRTFQIHGNIQYMRCADSCGAQPLPVPAKLTLDWAKNRAIGPKDWQLLQCADCHGRTRPHVLWFDECYDEERFRLDSSQDAAATCSILVIVGTSGTTNLPTQIARIAAMRNVPVVVVDKDPSQFAELAQVSTKAYLAQGDAVALLPAIAAAM